MKDQKYQLIANLVCDSTKQMWCVVAVFLPLNGFKQFTMAQNTNREN